MTLTYQGKLFAEYPDVHHVGRNQHENSLQIVGER